MTSPNHREDGTSWETNWTSKSSGYARINLRGQRMDIFNGAYYSRRLRMTYDGCYFCCDLMLRKMNDSKMKKLIEVYK